MSHFLKCVEKVDLNVSIFGSDVGQYHQSVQNCGRLENDQLPFRNYNHIPTPINPEKISPFWYENYLVKGVFKVWVKLASSLVSLVLLASHSSVQVN